MLCCIFWQNVGPYHLARHKAAANFCEARNIKIIGTEYASYVKLYPWEINYKENLILPLFPECDVAEISSTSYIHRTINILGRISPDILVICGYDHCALLIALFWAKMNKKVAVLMTESKADDLPRKIWKEWVKRRIVCCFDAALVGGRLQKEYAVALGLPPERVFTGYDVVDNEHYARGAEAARREEAAVRRQLGLPRPYFLTVARFIEKKNLFRLIQAYQRYRPEASDPWDLVLCGSGPLERKLKEAAAALPGVHFPGFKQADELPAYYGLAGCFILPSSHFEQWGLVVNEAMAAGLPVLVSRVCGCTPDLVQEGVNGFTFDPYDVEGLARLMIRMSSGEVDLEAMGEASRQIIAQWTPEVFAENLFRAIDAALAYRQTRKPWWQRLFASS